MKKISKKIGILGGGQLARMLAIQAESLACDIFVLCPSSKEPAPQLPSVQWVKGDPYNSQSLLSFLKKIDILSFESEFIPASHIENVYKKIKASKKITIAPNLKSLSSIQDRYHQKQLIAKHNLATSPFVKVSFKSLQTGEKQKKSLLPAFNELGAFVLKTRTGGYDGYGTFIFKKKSDLSRVDLSKASSKNFIAEKFISFKKELAILAVRNKKGQIVFSPLVETKQKDSRCFWVKGPVTHKKLNSLKKKIKLLMEDLNYQGVLAFELFDTGSNLLINELAPRVHNSGHYSLDGLTEDQFLLHLKAISGLDLKTPKPLKKGFAMLNILGGSKTIQGQKEEAKWKKKINKQKSKQDFHFWWYKKSESRKGRKMGHINALGSSATNALNKLLKLTNF